MLNALKLHDGPLRQRAHSDAAVGSAAPPGQGHPPQLTPQPPKLAPSAPASPSHPSFTTPPPPAPLHGADAALEPPLQIFAAISGLLALMISRCACRGCARGGQGGQGAEKPGKPPTRSQLAREALEVQLTRAVALAENMNERQIRRKYARAPAGHRDGSLRAVSAGDCERSGARGNALEAPGNGLYDVDAPSARAKCGEKAPKAAGERSKLAIMGQSSQARSPLGVTMNLDDNESILEGASDSDSDCELYMRSTPHAVCARGGEMTIHLE